MTSSPFGYHTDVRDFDLGTRCPECRTIVHAVPIAQPVYKSSEVSDEIAFVVCRCARGDCRAIMLVEYDRLNNRVFRVHPRPSISADNYHASIPPQVRGDFAEAVRCFYAEAYRAVVVMCRRAMQEMMIDRGATARDLADQIDEIAGRGLITAPLQKAAHEVRLFGNFGAHPRDDELDKITRDDADAVLRVTQNFTHAPYIQPDEVEKLKRKREPKP